MTTEPTSAPDIVAELRDIDAWGDPNPVDDIARRAADEIERLRISLTLTRHNIAYYLADTIADPVERQRIAVERFGRPVAKLTAQEAP